MSSSYFRRTVLYRRPNLTPEKKIVMILKIKGWSHSSKTFSPMSPVTNEEDGDGSEECIPPPQHEVDLLIDDILGEDAESVVALLPAGRPDVGDRARHLGREDCAHGVDLEQA